MSFLDSFEDTLLIAMRTSITSTFAGLLLFVLYMRYLLWKLGGGLLFLTFPTGGEVGGLTKEDEIFLEYKQ